MRSLILQGAENKINIDMLRRELGSEIDIAYNSLPEDWVAIFDHGQFHDWDWPIESRKTPDVTDTGRANIKDLEGPDYTASAIQFIKEGQLIQPPEEATIEGPEQ